MDFAIDHRLDLTLLSGRAHYDRVVASVLEAERSVWIATANLKELLVEDARAAPGRRRASSPGFRSVLEYLDELTGRGVELRILHAGLPSRSFRETFDRLMKEYNKAGSDEERKSIAEQLLTGSQAESSLVRYYAVRAMSKLDPAAFVEALQTAAGDEDATVRAVAKKALRNQAGATSGH